ncbi:leukocyte surface antigen CD53 [Pelodytes ibericus]
MSQKCLKVMKYMMFMFNLLFWVAGCSVISIGIYFVINNLYGTLLPKSPSLTVGNVLIATGCIIMVFGFVGCMGAIKENKCLLLTFFILLLLMLIIEVIMAIVLYMYERQINNYLMEQTSSSFLLQKNDINQNATRQMWHEIQQSIQCCGINGTQDWGSAIPSSCCPNANCVDNNFFKTSCFERMKMWFEDNFLYVGIVTICISVVEVLGMSFALTLYCHLSRHSVSLNK